MNDRFNPFQGAYQSVPKDKPPLSLTSNDYLARILDALLRQQQTDVPTDFAHCRNYKLDTGIAGVLYAQEITEYGWLYVPNAPRDLTIWYGAGKGRLLGSVASGKLLVTRFPRIDVLTIDYAATGTDTLDIWLSTRPMDVWKTV